MRNKRKKSIMISAITENNNTVNNSLNYIKFCNLSLKISFKSLKGKLNCKTLGKIGKIGGLIRPFAYIISFKVL